MILLFVLTTTESGVTIFRYIIFQHIHIVDVGVDRFQAMGVLLLVQSTSMFVVISL